MKAASTLILALAVAGLGVTSAEAENTFHPPVVLKDNSGEAVVASGKAVSPMQTCGECHDTGYIAGHSSHGWLGMGETESMSSSHSFDPFDYERLDPQGGERHVGGGSGVAEMNCFLCHLVEPDNEARVQELKAGRLSWAATATLAKTGTVIRNGDKWSYPAGAFKDGAVDAGLLGIQDPGNANCGQCHGAVWTGRDEPFFLAPAKVNRKSETTGALFTPYRIRRSGMNIVGKDALTRPWDVHAERLLECVDCHGSPNNPANFIESDRTRPDHLISGAKGLDIGEYLAKPSHNLATRNCNDCHKGSEVHTWLPYPEHHMEHLSCESCHIPKQYAPTRQQTDWTVLGPDQEARVAYRSIDGDPADPRTMIAGYEPVLLPPQELDGTHRLTPQNLITSWYWFDETLEQPVPLATLRDAYFSASGGYRPEIISALDADRNGTLEESELHLDTPEHVATVKRLLTSRGVSNPVIRGEIHPYGIHHGVAPAEWAVRDCQSCHGESSQLGENFELATYVPGGVLPSLVEGSDVRMSGEIFVDGDGRLLYSRDAELSGFAVVGLHHNAEVDIAGRWIVVLTLLGVILHGSIRVFVHVAANGKDNKRGAA